ncbi:transporter [Variovorax sp. dw_954]|uniref:SphA family protein n=1 Tax=Variovorax sp. dw_954 TaxID=2720078 RepID=UPI001BD66662|nr:transporter [Variovorax sp. dw_954]
MSSRSRPLIAALAALGAWSTQIDTARATEGGGNSYPIGVDNTFAGYMLPEGANWLLFYQHYAASHYKDNAGNDSAKFSDFHLRADVIAPRLSYVWPGVLFLGANVETRIVQPVSGVDLTLGIARRAPLPPLDKGGEKTGLADMSFSPIILGWHGTSFHQTLGIETHLRTGSYDVRDNVNTGRNYNQVAPVYAFTWFPDSRSDVSAKFRYGINDRNGATGYHSGDEASIEFSAGYRVMPQLLLGLNGYVYRQTTDDDVNGATVPNNKGRVNALGLFGSYRITPKFALTLRMQSEFGARNRPQGTRLWAMLLCPF